MLTVYKASAGSGKTFQLVAEYLKLLLINPYNYRHILAVTFTNKATSEMKSRIMEQLHRLSRDGDSPYMEWLRKAFQVDEETVREKAQQALNNILHDYSRFSVSTIDSFTQRVIKAFNREIGISPYFVLELDNDLILEEAVDRLLARVDTDHQLRKWLIDYSREKIMENRSQRLESDIKELGKELFREKFQVFFPEKDEAVYTRENLNVFRNELSKIINWFESRLKKEGENAVLIFKSKGLHADDFSGKGRGIGAFFEKLAAGEQPNVTATVIAHTESLEKWVTRSSDKKEVIQHLAETTLQPLLKALILFVDENSALYQSSAEVLKQLRILGILTDLKEEIRLLLQEKGILQLSDSNLLLNKIIGNSESPFIYEKIGERYNFFMIDEFQDTSLLQWRNFRPLVANALSEGHPALLVGDVKQSIYRWRNSDWNILASRIDEEFEQHPPAIVALNKNWRSRSNIIRFNNAIVGAMKKSYEENLFSGFEDESYLDRFDRVYQEYLQVPGNKEDDMEGLAEISFLEEDDFEERSAELLIEQVKRLQDKGLKPSDTAILIRKRSEGAYIVDAFMDAARQEENKNYNLAVLSGESLFLYASRGVNFVVLVMELLVNSDEVIQKTALLHLWLSWLKPLQKTESNVAGAFHGEEKAEAWLKNEAFDALFETELGKKIKRLQEAVSVYSLDETIMRICSSFGLFDITSELPYLQTLIDQAAEIKISLSNDVSNFLYWWKVKGCNTSVSVNEEVEAIRLLTIHKAKGLEFEAVLLPFFNFDSSWTGNQAPVLWCSSDVKPFNRFPLLPVKAGAKLAGTFFRNDYFEEKMSSLIDSLNLFYVAFTRAKSVLFVNCKKPAEKKGNEQGKTVNALLAHSLNMLGADQSFASCWNTDKTKFSYGSISGFQEHVKTTEDTYPEQYHFNDITRRLRLMHNSEEFLVPAESGHSVKNLGKLVHEILASVHAEADIEQACSKALKEGLITIRERDEIRAKLEVSLKKPVIRQWFDGSYQVLNERNLLTGDKLLRPDRIMISGRNAVVADYKWGEVKQSRYNFQVKRYAEVLKKCGFDRVEGFIWYINLDEVEKVGEWH